MSFELTACSTSFECPSTPSPFCLCPLMVPHVKNIGGRSDGSFVHSCQAALGADLRLIGEGRWRRCRLHDYADDVVDVGHGLLYFESLW